MLPIARTARADEDLIEIWMTIAAKDRATADRILDQIEVRWQQLCEHPSSGAARDDIGPGVRHLVVHPYLILYRVESRAARILRVLHGRRDIGRDTEI